MGVVGIALATVVLAITVVGLLWVVGVFAGKRPATLFERLAADVGFRHPWACTMSVRTPDREIVDRWPTARRTATLFCLTENRGFVDGYIEYARFESSAARAVALRKVPPPQTYCVFGSEVVVQGDSPRFAALCAHRGGVLHRIPVTRSVGSTGSARAAGSAAATG